MAADHPILVVVTIPEVINLVRAATFPCDGGRKGSKELPAF